MAEITIKFGTDGWRGTIAEDYTFDNVRRCAQGFASFLTQRGHKGDTVVVGYDRRFDSEHFASAVSEVLAANGFHVDLTQSETPTPVISYSVVARQATGAVNITASHNPATDDGFKVRDEHGGAIDPEGLNQIEALIPSSIDQVKRMSRQDAESQGLIQTFDPAPAYLTHLKDLIDVDPIKQAGLKIVYDPMWGNGAGWIGHILSGGKTQIEEIHSARNPIFPEMLRPEPIPPNIDVGLEKTKEEGANVLIITDGDADRLGIGDESGRFINQLQVYGLLAFYMLEVRGERGPIVKTLSTTSMLDKLGQLYDVPIYETGVGFKYVAPKMLETNALMGGEESGGYAFRGHIPERDGILAALYFLDMMVRLNRKPSELLQLLFSKVGPHYYDRIDHEFHGDRQAQIAKILSAKPSRIGGLAVTGLNDTDGYKFLLEDGGWLLIRFSGTEPLVRVYCETTDESRVQSILRDGLAIAGLE
jgi:phosphomannomutase